MSNRTDIAEMRVSVTTHDDGDADTMLDRYLGNTSGAASIGYEVPNELEKAGLTSIRLIDTDASPQPVIDSGRSITHWHVLWIRDEAIASVTIASTASEKSWPIAPGDTISIPPGHRLITTGGQLGLAISEADGASSHVDLRPPSHGEDDFAGYNRRTTIPSPGDHSLFRWKLTQPFELRQHHAGDLALILLAGDPAILTRGTVLAPSHGRGVFVPAGSKPLILPNGLTYLLVIAPPTMSP